MAKLAQKNIIVFGGSTGIGQAIALAGAKEGANIIIASRSETHLKETKESFKKNHDLDITTYTCDVTSISDIKRIYNEVEQLPEGLYGVVCCAGIYGPIGPLETNSLEKWKECIEVNLIGSANCIHLALEKMKKRKTGRFVLMSGGGQTGMPNFSAYTTAKGGIWRLTETLGAELAPYNIYLNAIAPGAVNTKMLQDVIDAGAEKSGESFYQRNKELQKSGGTPPEKAAQCAVYLLSDVSKGLSGKILSAVWDPYQDFQNTEAMSKSDIFTMKRVVDNEGGTRVK